MYETEPFVADSQNYRFGFLAAAVQELLRRPIGSQLSEEEVGQLRQARNFLNDVIAGAKLVSTGEESGAVSAEEAVGALNYALGPLAAIEALRSSSERDGLVSVFEVMLICVDSSLESGRVSGSPVSIEIAVALFEYLSSSILAAFDQRTHLENLSA